MYVCIDKSYIFYVFYIFDSAKVIFFSMCSVPKNRPNYVDSQSHKKYL